MENALFLETLREMRRHFHSYPELGFREVKTKEYLHTKLGGLTKDIKLLGGGLVASLKRGEGKTVLLRADMDALPLQDTKDAAYASKVAGVCHACGHDGHMAMVYGALLLLLESDFRGQVKFLFQPAEELPPGGAIAMVEEGALQGVDFVLGLHLNPHLPFGTVGLKEGPLMAAVDNFSLTIRGRMGHGALPDKCVDAIVTASQAVVALQGIASRFVDPLEPMVLTIGTIKGGTAKNIVAGEVEMTGTVRTTNPQLREEIPHLMKRVLAGITAAHGAGYNLEYTRGYPVLINDRRVLEVVRQTSLQLWGDDSISILEKPVMGGEDFSYFLNAVPGCFAFLGTHREGFSTTWHHSTFDFDEEILPRGARLLANAAEVLLKG